MAKRMSTLEKQLQRANLERDIETARLEATQASHFRAQWEAIDPSKDHRRKQPAPARDTQERQLLYGRNRLKACEFARQMLRSAPIAAAIVENLVANIVGTGPKLQFMFDDNGAKADYQAYWNEWTRNCDRSGRFDWYDMCALVVAEKLTTGEILPWWDRVEAKIALFEAENIKKVADWEEQSTWNKEYTQFDGLKLDAMNRIVEFAVAQIGAETEVRFEDVTILDAADCQFSRLLTRYSDVRGNPPLLKIAPFLDDVRQLLLLELQSAKAAAAHAVAIKKKSGPPTGSGRVKGSATATSSSVGSYPQLEQIYGARMAYLGLDEELDILGNDRPSPNIASFTEFVTLLAGSAIGLPISHTLLKTSTSYSAARNEGNQAEITYQRWQQREERGFYSWSAEHAIQHGIDTGALSEYPNWKQALKWKHQRRMDIDPMKAARARQVDLDTYYSNLADWHDNWEARIEQREREKELIGDQNPVSNE